MRSWAFVASFVLAVSFAAASPSQPRDSRPTAAGLPDDVIFHLFTSNGTESQIIRIDDYLSLNSSTFDPSVPTKFVIHGYTDDISSPSIQVIKDAYMTVNAGYNVFGVHWGSLASGPNYNSAVRNVLSVGEYVGLFMDYLVVEGEAHYRDFHVLGHDIGAHVAGIAASTCGGLIARATGLDPALSGFETAEEETLINSFDAKYVDIIHTDGGQKGFMEPLGDADFYPNGGIRIQVGCGITDPTGSCSHAAAFQFYSYSIITPDDFQARACDTLLDIEENGNCDALASALMGEGSSETSRGLFHLRARVE